MKFPDPSIDVPKGDTRNVNGEEPELNQENFIKLCRKVTELVEFNIEKSQEIEDRFRDLEGRLQDLEDKVDDASMTQQELEEAMSISKQALKLVSLARVEASELKHLESTN